MAKRKIIWSQSAKIKLYHILEFYAKRNKSKSYSAKLYAKFNKELKLLLNHPDLGIKTEIESVRGLIVDDYIIFYEELGERLIIHTVWNSRQDIGDLKIK